jgi:hypothetical protein
MHALRLVVEPYATVPSRTLRKVDFDQGPDWNFLTFGRFGRRVTVIMRVEWGFAHGTDSGSASLHYVHCRTAIIAYIGYMV